MIHTYGHDGTIHDSEHIDVEVDNTGRVVAVWFRCMSLPFTQSVADDFRADQMRGHYSKIKLKAIQYDDEDEPIVKYIDRGEGKAPWFWQRWRKWLSEALADPDAVEHPPGR